MAAGATRTSFVIQSILQHPSACVLVSDRDAEAPAPRVTLGERRSAGTAHPAAPARASRNTGHDVPWYGIPRWLVQVSCPGYAPSQLLAHLLAGRAWETEKSLA